MFNVLIAIVQAEPKKSLLRSAFGLWGITAAIGIVLVITVWASLAARRGRRLANGVKPRRRRRAIPDAWAEAGRRVEPIRMDEPEPPTASEP